MMARKRNRWRWLFRFLMALLALAVLYLAVSPLVLPWCLAGRDGETVLRVMELDEQIRGMAATAFLTAWVFMVGAAVGSFLNVVAWRMPRGESVVSRPSHCPYCDANIRAQDNLPVFGWLLLGGRCRVCRLPISPRYPIVEAIVGFAFLALALVEPARHGANLPGFTPSSRFDPGIVELIASPDWLLLGRYGYHCLLLGLLTSFALIKYDFHRLPAKLVTVGLAMGFLLPAIWPDLYPVPTDLPRWAGVERFDVGLVGALFGAWAGRMLDLLLPLVIPKTDPRRASWNSSLAVLASVGLFLGWQAIASIALITAGFALLGSAFSRGAALGRRMPLCGWIGLATLVHLTLWGDLEQVTWSRIGNWPLWWMILAVAFANGLVMLSARIGKPPENCDYNRSTNSDSAPGDESPLSPESDTAAESVSVDLDAETALESPHPPEPHPTPSSESPPP